MLDYTKAAFDKIIDDIKKVALYFEFFTQIFMIAYLIYALFTAPALVAVNAVLLVLTLLYLFFFLQNFLLPPTGTGHEFLSYLLTLSHFTIIIYSRKRNLIVSSIHL